MTSKTPVGPPRASGLRRKVSVGMSGKKRVLDQDDVPETVDGQSSVSNVPEEQPTKIRRTSLADRLKRNLLHKNGRRTPSPVSRRLEARMAEIKQATEAMRELKREQSQFFGLSRHVGETLLQHKGIQDLYEWQKECLTLPAIEQAKNLIYSLPTSGGKTLVAEILILKEMLVKKRNAILVLPYVSIVQEKIRTLAGLSVALDFAVEEYAGSKGMFPPRRRRNRKSLYVCTIEKSNTLVSVLIEAGRMSEIGLVVVDELHMLGDGDRGAILELAITKLLHCAPTTQIVAMSATLSNIGELQTFLNADLYTNDFRPVSLTEYIKVDDGLYEIPQNSKSSDENEPFQLARVLEFRPSEEERRMDPDSLLGLLLEVVPTNSCLVFCPTKKNCENVADMLAKLMSKDFHHVRTAEKKELLRALKDNPNSSICPVLKRTIPYGLAYHHSGLTSDERKLLEEAYSAGTLCALMCTSTLAAGVNLPAKRVILRSVKVGLQTLTRSQYKQMVGRAGRAGIDTSGESILLVKSSEKVLVRSMVTGPMNRCQSSLLDHKAKALKTLLLGMVGLKVATSAADSLSFLSKTLSAVQLYSSTEQSENNLRTITQTALQELLAAGLISQRTADLVDLAEPPDSQPLLEVTTLGKATFKSGIDITRSGQVYEDLVKARESLNVASYLHLLYLSTPYDMVDQCNPAWMVYLNQFCALSSTDQELAGRIGVTEAYLNRRASGQRAGKQSSSELVCRRFYLSLMLYDLWQEKSVWEVADKFEQNRGFVQNLLTAASSFASAIYHFCQELEEFWAYQDLLGNFVKRLAFCSSAELIPLLEIPGVKQARARQLFKAGYSSLSKLAASSPDDLVRDVDHLSNKVAKDIITAAKMLLTERVESLRDEASELLQIVMPESAVNAESQIMEKSGKTENDDSNGTRNPMNDFVQTAVAKQQPCIFENRDDNEANGAKYTVSVRTDELRNSALTETLQMELSNGIEDDALERTLTDEELVKLCDHYNQTELFTGSRCVDVASGEGRVDLEDKDVGKGEGGQDNELQGDESGELFTPSMNESHSAAFAEDEEMFTPELLDSIDPT